MDKYDLIIEACQVAAFVMLCFCLYQACFGGGWWWSLFALVNLSTICKDYDI